MFRQSYELPDIASIGTLAYNSITMVILSYILFIYNMLIFPDTKSSIYPALKLYNLRNRSLPGLGSAADRKEK